MIMFCCGDFLARPDSDIECARAEVQFTPACQPHRKGTTTDKLVVREGTRIRRIGLFMGR